MNNKGENPSIMLENIRSQEIIIYEIVKKLNQGFYSGTIEIDPNVLESIVPLTTFIGTCMMDINWHMYRAMYPETRYERVLNNRMLTKTVHEIYYNGKIYNLINQAIKATNKQLDLKNIKIELGKIEIRNKDQIKIIRDAVGGHIDKDPKVLYDHAFVGKKIQIEKITMDTYTQLVSIIVLIRLYVEDLMDSIEG